MLLSWANPTPCMSPPPPLSPAQFRRIYALLPLTAAAVASAYMVGSALLRTPVKNRGQCSTIYLFT